MFLSPFNLGSRLLEFQAFTNIIECDEGEAGSKDNFNF